MVAVKATRIDGKDYVDADDFLKLSYELTDAKVLAESLKKELAAVKKRTCAESAIKDNDILQVSLKRGNTITYQASSFTDYMIRDGLFVIIKGTQWIGMYNMDCVEYVAYIPEDKIEQ